MRAIALAVAFAFAGRCVPAWAARGLSPPQRHVLKLEQELGDVLPLDVNGDGLLDLLLSVDRDCLGVHFGKAKAFWSDTPDEEIVDKLPIRPDRIYIADLNGDGQDDLIFLYNRDDIRTMPEVNHSVVALLSRYAPPKAGSAPRARPVPDGMLPPKRIARLPTGQAR